MKNEILEELWKVKGQLVKENDYDIEKYHKETDTNTYHIHEVYYSDDGIIESRTIGI